MVIYFRIWNGVMRQIIGIYIHIFLKVLIWWSALKFQIYIYTVRTSSMCKKYSNIYMSVKVCIIQLSFLCTSECLIDILVLSCIQKWILNFNSFI